MGDCIDGWVWAGCVVIGPVRLMLACCAALIVPVALYQLAGGSSWKAEQRSVERLAAQADRRNHLIEGLQNAQGVMSWIDYYYFENWRLPESVDDLRHGLPKPYEIGPTAYAFDPDDGSVTMFFEGRKEIATGEITFTPTVDDENKKLEWECWTPDYKLIHHDLPTCTYQPSE